MADMRLSKQIYKDVELYSIFFFFFKNQNRLMSLDCLPANLFIFFCPQTDMWLPFCPQETEKGSKKKVVSAEEAEERKQKAKKKREHEVVIFFPLGF